MLCIYVGCALCLFPGSAPSALGALSGRELLVLLFCALNTLVGYGTFAAALEHWEASRVSAVLSLTPLATLAFSAAAARLSPDAFVPERLGAQALAGAALVVAGSLATSLGGRPAS
jgi:drug/metabolite transporter (DMT)-like permease